MRWPQYSRPGASGTQLTRDAVVLPPWASRHRPPEPGTGRHHAVEWLSLIFAFVLAGSFGCQRESHVSEPPISQTSDSALSFEAAHGVLGWLEQPPVADIPPIE
jgi:hypothetical protein